jgi:hypothetical protein
MRAPEIRLMSMTESDFLRILPYSLEGQAFAVRQGEVETIVDAGIIRITLAPQLPTIIASLSMPALKVSIDLGILSDSAAREFMRQFNRAFHRGGG